MGLLVTLGSSYQLMASVRCRKIRAPGPVRTSRLRETRGFSILESLLHFPRLWPFKDHVISQPRKDHSLPLVVLNSWVWGGSSVFWIFSGLPILLLLLCSLVLRDHRTTDDNLMFSQLHELAPCFSKANPAATLELGEQRYICRIQAISEQDHSCRTDLMRSETARSISVGFQSNFRCVF